jgi:antitoxin component YwqK of YwqJK toxin-antitoxin module
MLKNVKSNYILKHVFSYIDERKKLYLIKYNKNFQNKLNINLIIYKAFSKKFIIYDNKNNKEGREFLYYKDSRIYQGEYLNGQRHGRGEEYNDKGDIIFEGEYLYGKRIKGKIYDCFNNIYDLKDVNGIVEEYYDNNIQLVNKKYYNYNCKLRFKGEYLNGKRHGKGKEYYHYNDNTMFEGEYLNGKRHGKGTEYNENGVLEFEGEYLYGKRWNGKEYDIYKNIVDIFKNGNGKFKKYDYYRKLKFEGEYLNGEIFKSKEYSPNGILKFENEYLYGMIIKRKDIMIMVN